jgi:23S rRNA pseudouridine1911/1915/1917 synthase
VHLSEQQRTPILADSLYGSVPAEADLAGVALRLGRQALHAAVLSFVHPKTGDRLRFEAPLPGDMSQALAELRGL